MHDKSESSAIPLGHQIRRLREARGWTLADLARRVVDRRTRNYWGVIIGGAGDAS